MSLTSDIDTLRNCRRCGVDLAVGVNWDPSNAKSYSYLCKKCKKQQIDSWKSANPARAREHWKRSIWKRRKIEITVEEYKEKLEQQNYVCKICQGVNRNCDLAVDHNHKTGQVRDLLCIRCNNIIGFLEGDRSEQYRAYLEKWGECK